MAISTAVTMGYSVSGGYQGGVTTLARLGYSYQSVVVAGYVCISTAYVSVAYASGTLAVPYSTATVRC